MSPDMLSTLFHPTGAYSLLNWYQEFIDELFAHKETMDLWKTQAHDKGGTSKFQEHVDMGHGRAMGSTLQRQKQDWDQVVFP